jgi:hypothetical protein
MPAETQPPEPSEMGDFVLATYREIAQRFGLGGTNAARTKAKRARWEADIPNHPADALRIRVPRDAWEHVGETLPRTLRKRGHSKARDAPSQVDESQHIKALEAHIATLHERLAETERRLAREVERADAADAQAEWNAGRADRADAELRRERDAARRLGEQIAGLAGDVARLAVAQEKDADAPAARWRRWAAAWFGRG